MTGRRATAVSCLALAAVVLTGAALVAPAWRSESARPHPAADGVLSMTGVRACVYQAGTRLLASSPVIVVYSDGTLVRVLMHHDDGSAAAIVGKLTNEQLSAWDSLVQETAPCELERRSITAPDAGWIDLIVATEAGTCILQWDEIPRGNYAEQTALLEKWRPLVGWLESAEPTEPALVALPSGYADEIRRFLIESG